MQLGFERELYHDSYVEIFDRCDYQLMDTRVVTVMKMDQVINTTLRIKQTL